MKTTPEISKDSRLKRMDGLVGCDIDEEIVIMSIANGEYYNFNEIASAIWRTLETPHPVSEIIGKLTDSYDISTEKCEQNVIFFLQKLKHEGLVCVE